MLNCERIIFKGLLNSIKNIMEELEKNPFNSEMIYIGFNKSLKNVIFPQNVQEESNTVIVLHDNFFNLKVDKDGFGVSIEISKKTYNIYIPFNSINLFSVPDNDIIINFEDNILTILKEEDDEEGKITFVDFTPTDNNN